MSNLAGRYGLVVFLSGIAVGILVTLAEYLLNRPLYNAGMALIPVMAGAMDAGQRQYRLGGAVPAGAEGWRAARVMTGALAVVSMVQLAIFWALGGLQEIMQAVPVSGLVAMLLAILLLACPLNRVFFMMGARNAAKAAERQTHQRIRTD